jgi:hypothetical protein
VCRLTGFIVFAVAVDMIDSDSEAASHARVAASQTADEFEDDHASLFRSAINTVERYEVSPSPRVPPVLSPAALFEFVLVYKGSIE